MSLDNNKAFLEELNDLKKSTHDALNVDCNKYWDCIQECYNNGGKLGCTAGCAKKYPGCTNLEIETKVNELFKKYGALN